MKETYLAPNALFYDVHPAMPLAVSGVTSDNGIGYGGVDEEGTKEPGARRGSHDVWDNEEEEDF